MENLSNKKFPHSSTDYKLYQEVGEGVSAIVYRALCIPLNKIVAIKILDLEKCNNDLDNIRREVHTMSLINHPNLLRAHCSFIVDRSLWIVMPFMAGGSCLHIMKSACPDGFEQPVIATVLYQILKALSYLHAQGHIHRDVKAGNILIDSKGAVKLGDFGVSASMYDTGDRQRSRNTFVGTPCWMAPEVMQQLHGYDFKADIWSFGITALELAHGHAPFSKYPPMKVLLMTLQNAPPSLNYERDKKFSKSFKEMVAACLVKDPKKRPSVEKILKHRFFKHSRPNEFLVRTILDGLPPLDDRFRMLKEKEAQFPTQVHGNKEQISQQEYIRGISEWNFDLEDLKKQAALIQDYDGISTEDNQDSGSKHERSHNLDVPKERLSMQRTSNSNFPKFNPSLEDCTEGVKNVKTVQSSVASPLPLCPEQVFNNHFDNYPGNGTNQLINEKTPKVFSLIMDNGSSSFGSDDLKFNFSLPRDENSECSSLSWSIQSKNDFPMNKVGGDREINHFLNHQKKDNTESPSGDENFQCHEWFKVSMADSSAKSDPEGLVNSSVGDSVNSMTNTSVSILSSLRRVLQQNSVQREQTVKLIRYAENLTEFMKTTNKNESFQMLTASVRERELQSQVINMQLIINKLVDDLQEHKNKNFELKRQLSILLDKA